MRSAGLHTVGTGFARADAATTAAMFLRAAAPSA